MTQILIRSEVRGTVLAWYGGQTVEEFYGFEEVEKNKPFTCHTIGHCDGTKVTYNEFVAAVKRMEEIYLEEVNT